VPVLRLLDAVASYLGAILVRMSVPLSEWSGVGATREPHEAITAFNEQTAAQTATMIRLARAIALLTVLMLLGLVVQIVLAT
jgi:hypothetical protein